MLRRLFLLAALACCAPVHADVSGTMAVLSDLRYRGYSLSNSRPVAQAGLAWDGDDGMFAGALLSGARFGDDTGWEKQVVGWLGLAGRFASGLGWETGVVHSSFTSSHDYDFGEVFAGLNARAVSLRFYYSPNYYLQGRASLYGELSGALPLADRVSLQAHLGVLRLDPLVRDSDVEHGPQADVRVGLQWELTGLTLGLAWSDGARRPLFRESADAYDAGSALQISASHAF